MIIVIIFIYIKKALLNKQGFLTLTVGKGFYFKSVIFMVLEKSPDFTV